MVGDGIELMPFQSTRPRGARPRRGGLCHSHYWFQSTRPRGARPRTERTIVWIEVKQPGRYLSPDQRERKAECEAFGDIHITARSLDDVRALFEPRRGNV